MKKIATNGIKQTSKTALPSDREFEEQIESGTRDVAMNGKAN